MESPTVDERLAALAERLTLDRPLAFIDLEATGLNPRRARIVDFGVLRLFPDGTHKVFSTLVNPGVPIPPQVTAVHGITDDMVKDAPGWASIGPLVAHGLTGSDLVAYSGRGYDLPLLKNEMARHGIPHGLDASRLIDPFQLWTKREPRTLAAYLERFGGIKDTTQHRAGRDVGAMVLGFMGQIDAWPDLPASVRGLHDMSADPSWIDADGKLAWMGGRPCVNFGESRGEALQDCTPGFLRWMLGQDFGDDVKRIVKAAIGGRFPMQEPLDERDGPA
jgi:DNA polymerase-3 subunit epsilon